MKVNGKPYRTIWPGDDGTSVEIIDQTRLPHEFVTLRLRTVDDAVRAIQTMQVRGAPLIGATAAYGLWLALRVDASDESLARAYQILLASRPTAINLRWALDRVRARVRPLPPSARVQAAFDEAGVLCDDDVATCEAIGRHGLKLFQRRPVKFEKDNDFDTSNAKAKATERYSVGWSDWRALFGSVGV